MGEEKKENLKGKTWKIEGKFEKEDVENWRKIWKTFETTEICLGSIEIYHFYLEKAYITLGQIREKWLCPLGKTFLLSIASCASGKQLGQRAPP